MRLTEVREGHVHLEVDGDDLVAINNSLTWIVSGMDPIAEDDLIAKTGLSSVAAANLLDYVHVARAADGLWLSESDLLKVPAGGRCTDARRAAVIFGFDLTLGMVGDVVDYQGL